MPDEEQSETGGPAVSERPWWTKWSKTAAVFVIFAVGGAVGGVVVPAAVQLHNSEADRDAQAALNQSAARLNGLNRRVEVTRLLFDHYFGKAAAEQRAAINYLRYQFPQDLGDKRIQAILVIEAKD